MYLVQEPLAAAHVPAKKRISHMNDTSVSANVVVEEVVAGTGSEYAREY